MAIIGDNAMANDVAVHHVCNILNPERKKLIYKEINGQYVSSCFQVVVILSRDQQLHQT